MGSATESNAKPQIPMAENEKKTFKKFLKVLFKKDKKKDKPAENEIPETKVTEVKPSIAALAVENVLQKLEKLDIKAEKQDDEFQNFSYKTVKDDRRSDSHSSEDSGFAEKAEASDGEDEQKDDELIVALEKLNIDTEGKGDDKCQKEKRTHTVVVSRQPIRSHLDYKSAPYYVQQKDPCRQIQINKHTLTGGQVIVNRSNDFLEVDAALKQIQQTSQHSQRESQDEWLNIITEYIQGDFGKPPQDAVVEVQSKKDAMEATVEELLSDFFQSPEMQQGLYDLPAEELVSEPEAIMTPPRQEQTEMSYYHEQTQNPIAEFSNGAMGQMDLTSLTALVDMPAHENPSTSFIFPTPPHSENAASPMSDSLGSFRTPEYLYSPSRSVILSSPERSSPICNSDYEKFQEISHYEEPVSISSVSLDDEKKRERNSSTSSMTMKQYKDLQKEISHTFSKKDCCQLTRKSCKQLFQEHLQKLAVEERRSICLKVAKMELKYAYGVLQNILRSLSSSSELEDLNHALFCLVCERVLAQMPAWFIEDFGLNLVKSAALRCPSRPLLTRYVVQCVRAAIRIKPNELQGKDSVFHEVDAQGDTLVTACARAGDSHADVLAEIVRREPEDLPLFRIQHLNSDGASALHVACIEHAANASRLHVVHVLLDHAGADLWQGDAKAGDTPVHMAVNAKHCDLKLIMVLFKHVDRKVWKKLAHTPNLCSTTPLEYARSATKSQVRDGYPSEVLEFLKKCR